MHGHMWCSGEQLASTPQHSTEWCGGAVVGLITTTLLLARPGSSSAVSYGNIYTENHRQFCSEASLLNILGP